MLRIIKNNTIENQEQEYPYNIYFNEILCEGAGVNIEDVRGEYGIYVLEISNHKTIAKLKEISLVEFNEIAKINFYGWSIFDVFTLNVEIERYNYDINDSGFTTFTILPDLSFWKKSFSFAEYQELFSEVIYKNFTSLGLVSGNNKYNEFTEIIYFVSHKFNKNKSIREELESYEDAIIQTHKIVLEELLISDDIISLRTFLNFPEDFKIPCEQYLLYFTQFLRDLGIDATSNLKEDAGKVLFSVTPTDETQALDKIREALAIYLNLPASPIVYDDSFAAMRLQQQIENLHHSQRMAVRELQFNEKLLVAQSDTIREKNITISQQQSVIEQQQKIIEKISSKSIMMDSAENKEELEELYDGVKVGESETLKKWLGISLNPAKAIKTVVKNTLGKEDKKSVLGLDEESQ